MRRYRLLVDAVQVGAGQLHLPSCTCLPGGEAALVRKDTAIEVTAPPEITDPAARAAHEELGVCKVCRPPYIEQAPPYIEQAQPDSSRLVERMSVYGVPATLVATAHLVLPGDEQVPIPLELSFASDSGEPVLRMVNKHVIEAIHRRFQADR